MQGPIALCGAGMSLHRPLGEFSTLLKGQLARLLTNLLLVHSKSIGKKDEDEHDDVDSKGEMNHSFDQSKSERG